MSIEQTKFLGATVTSFSSTVGWNEQQTSVVVRLVEDTSKGDEFAPPPDGKPVSFKFGDFEFEGLIQRGLSKYGTDGYPTYEVMIVDPREILDGAQVIIDSCNEALDIPNLLNVFGHWENKLGFGGALVNESGMLWQGSYEQLRLESFENITSVSTPIGIRPAIEEMMMGSGEFGGPLRFRGESYRVDLSDLPTPPAHYRIGGTSVSLLECVSTICQDGGCDFLVYLEGDTIKFKVVSRTEQPEPGQVANFIQSQENIINKSFGTELRNEVTNAVILGGDVHELVQVSNSGGGQAIWPFWGFDLNGRPILGQGDPEDHHEFELNASEIAGIIGGMRYHCTIPELRCALIDFDSWAAFVMRWYPAKANTIGLVGAVDSQSDLQDLFPDMLFQRDLISQRMEDAMRYGQMNDNDYWTGRAQTVYQFVQQYASEYFGRQFLVRLPFFIHWGIEHETTNIIASDEISQEGGWVPEGSRPLGLSYVDQDRFMTEDGRFQAFVRFPIDPRIDFQRLSYENATVTNRDLYVRATVRDNIVYPPGSLLPYCIIELDTPVYLKGSDPLGDTDEVAALFGVDPHLIRTSAGLRYGSFPVKIHPAPLRPTGAAIPLRRTRQSYGPWASEGGAEGKVHFERDDSLVPWNYGDWDTMEQAAQAKIAIASTKQTEAETGSFEMASLPEFSIGDELVSGGPNITSITCEVGIGGITTSYEMRTFTPQFASFTKSNAERLRRLGLAAQQTRRQIRALFQKRLQRREIMSRARLGFMENTSRAVRQQTPHEVIYGTMSWSPSLEEYRTQVASATVPEMLANVRPDDSEVYQATGGMSLEGLLRPFTTKEVPYGEWPMPHWEEPHNLAYIRGVTTKAVDPIRGSDIDILLHGDSYSGMHSLKDEINYDNARLLGLRGPMVMVGWGAEYTGKPIPNAGNEQGKIHEWDDDFLENASTHPERWRAGIVALHWDNWRKVWTVPTILMGKLDEKLEDGGSAMMSIKVAKADGSDGWLEDKVRVHLWLGGTLEKDHKVVATYYQLENRWYVTSAECK